jgi:hypothetical protein
LRSPQWLLEALLFALLGLAALYLVSTLLITEIVCVAGLHVECFEMRLFVNVIVFEIRDGGAEGGGGGREGGISGAGEGGILD